MTAMLPPRPARLRGPGSDDTGPIRRIAGGAARRWLAVTAATIGLATAACLPTGPGTERSSETSDGGQLEAGAHGGHISGDLRYVTVTAPREPLRPWAATDVLRKDRSTGELVPVSVDAAGARMPGHNRAVGISADGSRIVFVQTIENELGQDVPAVYVRDLAAATTTLVSVRSDGTRGIGEEADISSDGRYVAFTGSGDLVPGVGGVMPRVYVRDLELGTTRLASTTNLGAPLSEPARIPAISGDGRYVAFRTSAVLDPLDRDSEDDVYVRDLVGGTTTFESLSGPNSLSWNDISLSDDGRYVAFTSESAEAPTAQAWVRDRVTREVRLISHRAGSTAPGNGTVVEVDLSPDGEHVAFSSSSSDLVAGDTNGRMDVFVARRDGSDVTLVSHDVDGGPSNGDSAGGVLARGGQVVAFVSGASDLVEGDTNGDQDVFVNRR